MAPREEIAPAESFRAGRLEQALGKTLDLVWGGTTKEERKLVRKLGKKLKNENKFLFLSIGCWLTMV